MITFLNLGKKGNLGNQLFQIASTIGIADSNNQTYAFPNWKYVSFFKTELPLLQQAINFNTINEYCFEYTDYELKESNYNLNGWFQSEKYFCNSQIKAQFTFKENLLESLNEKYLTLINSKHILISVRRGDFVNNPFYFQLSYKYYFQAITECFPDWKSRNLLFTSDDISYCKSHFSFLKNAYFLEGMDAIEQLAFSSLCSDFIISNSTFSWWMAWLGERKNSKIIRPIKNFRGEFAEINNDKDFFPERWTSFQTSRKQLHFNYPTLVLKGEYFRIINYLNYESSRLLKVLKKNIKKVINQ